MLASGAASARSTQDICTLLRYAVLSTRDVCPKIYGRSFHEAVKICVHAISAASSAAWPPSAHALHTSTVLHVSEFMNVNGNMDASASGPIAVAWAAELCVTLDSRLARSRGHKRRHTLPHQKSDKHHILCPHCNPQRRCHMLQRS